MRVANTMVYNMVQSNLGNSARAMNDAAETAITGNRILTLSDDPIGVSQSLNIQSGLDGFEQVERGISFGNSWLTASENALTQSQNLIADTKILAAQMANSSISPADRIAAAEIVQNTIEEITSLANTKVGDRYIFSGSKTDKPAFTEPTTEVRTFEIMGSFEDTDDFSFNFMDQGNLTLDVADIIPLADPTDPSDVTKALASLLNANLKQANLDFQTETGSHAVITGVSSGTNSEGNNILTFTFAEGLDVDNDHDINLGFVDDSEPATTLTVSEQTIDTEGGFDYKGDSSPFSIKIGDSTVAIGNNGEEIFSDMFQTLAELKISLTNDTFVDTPAVVAVAAASAEGTEGEEGYVPPVEEVVGVDAITGVKDTMLNSLDDDFDILNVAITSVGTKMNRMDIKETIYQDLTLSETERLSGIVDADITEAITNLQQKQLAYQAALSASAKVMELSLLDYL